MHSKKQYIAPTLTVVTFKTERGYAQSSLNATRFRLNSLLGLNAHDIYSNQEAWGAEEDIFTDGWNI